MFVCDVGTAAGSRSPGKRTRKTTAPGAAVRVTPDKLYNSSDAHSPGPRSSWSASPSTVRRATPTHEYNLSLSEMRHYKDEDTMVLILSQTSAPAEEAEYPVPLEQDTSELLDAEDDDTLAGYAEVASRLVKPSPLHLPAHRPRNRSADPSRRLFYDDDVRHENLNSHSYEVDSLDTSSSAAGSAHAEGLSQTRAASQDPQGYSMPVDFSSAEAGIGPSSWAPEDPVVEPWQAHQNIDRQLGDLHSNSNGISHNDSPSSPGGKSAAAERSQSRGRAFSPSGSHGRHSGSASPKVHNGSIHRSPRAHNGASAGPEHQPVGSSSPDRGVNGSVRVSNGAHPRSSREARSEQRRASGRDIRSQSLPASPPEEPAEQPVADPAPQTLGFWDQQSSPATAPGSSSTQSDNNGTSSVGHGQQHRSRDALEGPVRREDGRSTEAPGRARPFFSSQMPAAVDQHGRPQREHEFTSADPTEPFFDINPTVPEGYKAGIPVHYPRRPVPRRPAGSKPSAPDARRKESLQTEFPVKANESQNGYQAEVDCDDLDQAKSEVAAQGDTAQLDGMLDHDPRNGSDKILESPNDHASRSFARAVSHSSLPSAMPEHSVRRGVSQQRNSAMRRSSRRDAHMQARIAKLDTSNLSHYSLPTLQRLAKDMGLSNCSRLSKSELVVQLVAEIILANMSLGWSVPEVAHGHLDEEDEGHVTDDEDDEPAERQYGPRPESRTERSSSRVSGSPRTVYRFGDSYDSEDEDTDSDVEVSPEVPPETVRRGQDVFSRIKQWLPFGRSGAQEEPDHSSGSVQQALSGSRARRDNGATLGDSRLLSGAGPVSLGGANVEDDFESLSALSMEQLQELCEDLGLEGWQRMRKYEMVGALLMDVYGLQQ